MIKAAGGIRGPSAAVMALSWKDSGITATTIPDGELKALSHTMQHVMNMRTIAEDCHNPQPPTRMDQDNQAVMLACRLSGNDKAFIHRRAILGAVSSTVQAGCIEIVTVPAEEQTADIQTKALPPLQHWKVLQWLLGRSQALLACQKVVFDRWLREPKALPEGNQRTQDARETYAQEGVWRGARPGANLAPAARQALMVQLPYDAMEEDMDRLCDAIEGGSMAINQLDGDLKLAVTNAAQLARSSPFADLNSSAAMHLEKEINDNRRRQEVGVERRRILKEEQARCAAGHLAFAAYKKVTPPMAALPKVPLYQQFVRQQGQEQEAGETRERDLRTLLTKRKAEATARAPETKAAPATTAKHQARHNINRKARRVRAEGRKQSRHERVETEGMNRGGAGGPSQDTLQPPGQTRLAIKGLNRGGAGGPSQETLQPPGQTRLVGGNPTTGGAGGPSQETLQPQQREPAHSQHIRQGSRQRTADKRQREE